MAGTTEAMVTAGNNLAQVIQAQQNYNAQQEEREYQHDLDQITMDRQDSSYQRMAADLEAAGLSKYALQPSGGSESGINSQAKAPQKDLGNLAAFSGQLIDMYRARSEVELRQAQARQANAQSDNLDASTYRLNSLTGLEALQSQAVTAEIQARTQEIPARINQMVQSGNLSKVQADRINKLLAGELTSQELSNMRGSADVLNHWTTAQQGLLDYQWYRNHGAPSNQQFNGSKIFNDIMRAAGILEAPVNNALNRKQDKFFESLSNIFLQQLEKNPLYKQQFLQEED